MLDSVTNGVWSTTIEKLLAMLGSGSYVAVEILVKRPSDFGKDAVGDKSLGGDGRNNDIIGPEGRCPRTLCYAGVCASPGRQPPITSPITRMS
jgi:hypothetical protein